MYYFFIRFDAFPLIRFDAELPFRDTEYKKKYFGPAES